MKAALPMKAFPAVSMKEWFQPPCLMEVPIMIGTLTLRIQMICGDELALLCRQMYTLPGSTSTQAT